MSVCVHIGCLRPVKARGVCGLHYKRAIAAGERAAAYRHGSAVTDLPMTRRERSQARLEDLEWLLANDVWPESAARRAGFASVKGARESAVRHGFRAAVRMLDEGVDRAAA